MVVVHTSDYRSGSGEMVEEEEELMAEVEELMAEVELVEVDMKVVVMKEVVGGH